MPAKNTDIVMNLVATHYISCTTLQLHITYGLHLPSCTALTRSHPPLHQSHSCHQSLINPDCFTTPASHSHTTYKQHTSLHTLRSLVLAPADISERLPFLLIATSVFDPGLPYLGTLKPVLVTSTLPGIVCLCSASIFLLLTIACLILPLSKINI